MNSKIKVSGNIISELSEKIPSNIIALNELLKNSYDAGAPKVTVILDTTNRILKIIDNGSGMNKHDIDALFHISNSTKKYGKINEYNRYTQGAKGLGFLSVFKFGKNVEWKTRKENEKGYIFKADYNSLVNYNDISQFEIEIIEDDTIEKGTSITILLEEYNAKSLESYFEIESNYKKILNSFDDETFTIELQINGTKYLNSNTPKLINYVPEYQLYYVRYQSKEQKIKFFYNNCEILTEDYLFDSKEYELDIELVIFHFPPYGKEKVDKLFFNRQNDLTPLLYVNSNLFNNYDLFDPNIMKNIKTQYVLNQIIGYVRIISDNSLVNFNSDRTQFLQNELTDSIKNFLSELNKRIQTTGSLNKNYLIKFDFLTVSELPPECNDFVDCEDFRKYIKNDFTFKSKVAIERIYNKVKYSLFGNEKELIIKPKTISTGTGNGSNGKGTGNGTGTGTGNGNGTGTVPAVINLNNNDVKLAVPTEQIDLKQYIASIYDSSANLVSNDLVIIKSDGDKINNGILSSVTKPGEKCIEYSYEDANTGIVVKHLNITFYRRTSKINGKSKDEDLISLPSKENYLISYNPSVANLIKQLNSLDLKDYLEVIACSLRAGFETSIDSINKSNKFDRLFTNVSSLEDRVVKVIDHIKSEKRFITEITTFSKIDYNSLKNILDAQRFRSGISTAHLGAHKAGTYITENDIKQLANLLGVFVVVVNEMLQNNNIN